MFRSKSGSIVGLKFRLGKKEYDTFDITPFTTKILFTPDRFLFLSQGFRPC